MCCLSPVLSGELSIRLTAIKDPALSPELSVTLRLCLVKVSQFDFKEWLRFESKAQLEKSINSQGKAFSQLFLHDTVQLTMKTSSSFIDFWPLCSQRDIWYTTALSGYYGFHVRKKLLFLLFHQTGATVSFIGYCASGQLMNVSPIFTLIIALILSLTPESQYCSACSV